MTGERPAGLTGAQLKTIAVAAMILDHIGVVFVPAGTVLHWALRCAGRLTMPIMCFFVAQGYWHTRHLGRYAARLFIGAALSHVPYALCFGYDIRNVWQATSVMWTLFVSLLALAAFDRLRPGLREAALLGCLVAVWPGSWNYTGLLWVLVFGMTEQKKGQRWGLFTLVSLGHLLQMAYLGSSEPLLVSLFVLAAMPLLQGYNGQRGYRGRGVQYGFYFIYPLHLLVLYGLRLLLG